MRKAIAVAVALWALPAEAGTTTTNCRRTLMGGMDCTTITPDNSGERAMQDGINSLATAIAARAARKRAEKAATLSTPPSEVPLVDLATGNGYLAGCSPNPASNINAGACFGYLDGFIQHELALGRPTAICLPDRVTRKQLMDVLNGYILAHPEDRHRWTAQLAAAAFITAFPCSRPEAPPAVQPIPPKP